MPDAAQLTKTIESLPREKYELVVLLVRDLSGQSFAKPDEKLINDTGLSSERKKFLETAGKIDVDEDAVNELRMRSMI